MNKLLYCFFLSFSVMATSACTDDKEERELPPTPDFSLMILKENLHSDGGDVLRTDTYVYDNNKLTTHTTLQEFYGQSLTHETTLSYSGNEVTLADENGNTAIYILGSAGYATECTYKLSDQVRKYTFTYSGEYLSFSILCSFRIRIRQAWRFLPDPLICWFIRQILTEELPAMLPQALSLCSHMYGLQHI